MYRLVFFVSIVFSTHCFGFENYVTRNGSKLYDGEQEFRFFGIHAPELHRIEDDARGTCKADSRPWGKYFKWPTPDEQKNWIQALTRSGHTAMRVYVLSVFHPDDDKCERETHILPPLEPGGLPRLNEKAMLIYDRMIALSDEHDLRLILPFIDHWQWWGGRAELAAFYGESSNDFYDTSSKTYEAYLHIIESVITRKNTITGRFYYDEKAIMAWETGNELKLSTPDFVTTTAKKIKGLAPNQLVVDGNYLSITPSSPDDENIDIISNHFYSVNGNNNPQTVIDDLTKIAGRKAYMVGEYGLIATEPMREIGETIVLQDVNGHSAVGGFVWGFRGHRHDGGFYWHKEGNADYQSYRLPGFPEAFENNEIQVVQLIRELQAKILGRTNPAPLPSPLPPKLRAIEACGELKFMGAPLGRVYRIEKRQEGANKWEAISVNTSDGEVYFEPEHSELFNVSKHTEYGKRYDFRVIALNESGESTPSNVLSWSKKANIVDLECR